MTRLLAEISPMSGVILDGRVFVQQSVRAAVLDGPRVLLLYYPTEGVYRFPGWSRHIDADPHEVLRTRLRAETGYVITSVDEVIGDIVEFLPALEEGFDVFEMVSRYYRCSVLPGVPPTPHDDDAQERRAVWVDVEVAMDAIESAIELGEAAEPWLRRERLALAFIRDEYLDALPT